MRHCPPAYLGQATALKPMALTSHKQFSFSHRVINNWNELPDSVVLSDNLNIFKRNLDLFWKDKDFKYEEKKQTKTVSCRQLHIKSRLMCEQSHCSSHTY